MSEQGDAIVVVRLGAAADAEVAARLHADLIADGFLARLGPRFLRHLYRSIVADPDSFLLVASLTEPGPRGGEPAVAGFLSGTLDLHALYRRFALRHGPTAALSSLPKLVGALPRVWETLRHGTAAADSDTGGPELLSMAVDPGWRGRHVGVRLVDAFLEELDRRHADRAQVVVGADNAAAVALYRRAGFVTERTFELHRGTPSLLMRRPPCPR